MTPTARSKLPVVAVVGRPNVGKSTLVNRILGRREAIVDATPGVTRDRRSFEAEWAGRRFEVVDTGGLEPGARGLEGLVREQAELAVAAADVIVLVTDVTTGPLDEDAAVAALLRRSSKPVVVAVNKVDGAQDEPEAAAFYRLGLGPPRAVSALHGLRSGDLLDAIVGQLPDETGSDDAVWASVAIVGRPNVGKSSLLNALVAEKRAIVDPLPGTTRDPVDALLLLADERVVRIVDTAGMRRSVRVEDPVEYFSLLRSRRTLERVDAALLVIDAQEGVTGHDQRIATEIIDRGRGCVVITNKWDLAPREASDLARMERSNAERLRFLKWAVDLRTSATTGRGIHRIGPAVADAIDSHRRRMPTAQLNDIVHEAQAARPHGRSGSSDVRILYAAQTSVSPPTVLLFTTAQPSESYLRYIEGRIRAAEPFVGSPLRVRWRLRNRRRV